MAPDDTSGGARCIHENAVEGPSNPECAGVAHIGGNNVCLPPKAVQILMYAGYAVRVSVDRPEFEQSCCVLEDMPSLSTGGCACVEHPHPWLCIQKLCRNLLTSVLY